ncbi:hypothetical protein F0L68_16285 [Solihabitans fulvus]|uniref:Uncharacterized protein n=1 Tax=Solihabitans fulvus TaxID=1892852 RepID=A0A5B2XFQ5_9PSEU|nr:hypothetical protein [Solihabitans fulvus]KAA2261632.1 hypothetical protein F0L68_16285 [Solihabitans fulvus]
MDEETSDQERSGSDRPLRKAEFRQFMEKEVWPFVPPGERGKPISKAEREEILGIGPDGVCA